MAEKKNKFDVNYMKKQAELKKKRKLNEQIIKKRMLMGFIIFIAAFVLMSAVLLFIDYNNSYVAKIDGRRITAAEFRYFLSNEKYYMISEVKDPEIDEATFWNTKIDGEDPLVITKQKALESARSFNVEKIKAKQEGVRLTSEDRTNASAYIESMIGQYYTTRQAKSDYLKSSMGITYGEYVKIIEDYFLVLKYRTQVKATIEVTDEQIKEYYEENKEDIDKVTIHHMVVEFNNFLEKDAEGNTVAGATLTDAQKEEARAKAVEILDKVSSGKTYEEILKEYYGEAYNAENQFEYTFTKSDSYIDEIKNWAFEHAVGESGIVESDYGFHVIKLTARTDYETIKEGAKDSLLTKKYDAQLEEWKKETQYTADIHERVYNGIE